MKKFIKIQLAVIMAFALCFTSCSKNDGVPTPTDNKSLLTGNTWSVTKFALDDNKNGKIDDTEYKPLPAGIIYDYLTFSTDGTLSIKASDGVNVSISGYYWELIDTQTIKSVSQAASHETNYWHIKTLTATQFNIELYDADNKTINSAAQSVAK